MNKPHKHYDVIIAWAKDPSKTVECRFKGAERWVSTSLPAWDAGLEYRIKPEPKPDVVTYGTARMVYGESAHVEGLGSVCGGHDNPRLTFDGETGKLKSAEVL